MVKIKENHEFKRAYLRGKSLISPYVVIYYLKNRTNNVRLGITAGKKLGGAVKRNRAKRVITAAFSSVAPSIRNGYDFVIVARNKILNSNSTAVASSISEMLTSAGLMAVTNENE